MSRCTMPCRVRVGEALGGLAHHAQRLGEGEGRPALEAAREVCALDVFEGQEEGVAVLAGVEQRDDVRVHQPAGRLGLAQQAALALLDVAFAALEAHRLDRELALDTRVLGEVHAAHRTHAQGSDDAIAADRLSGFEGAQGAGLTRHPAA